MGKRQRISILRWLQRLSGFALPPLLLAALLLAALPKVVSGSESQPPAPDAVARQTVAAALGLAEMEASVISSESRDFADGSLDCPQPGAAYAQVITPGYRVLVEANGRRFDVRVAGTAGRICYRRKPSPEPSPADGARPQDLGEAARADLALRLGVSPATIAVLGLHRLKPGAVLPGCGEVCNRDALPATCGMAVQLRAAERDFSYYALPAELRPCPEIAAR